MSAAKSGIKTVICNAQSTQIDNYAVLKYNDLADLFTQYKAENIIDTQRTV